MNHSKICYPSFSLNEVWVVPGTAQVRGFTDSDATVSVNVNGTCRYSNFGTTAQSSSRSGATSTASAAQTSFFYGGDEADNTTSNLWKELEVYAAINPSGTNTPDVVYASTGTVFIAKTPEQFTYDADGNMTSDGRFHYFWNGENRLVCASNAEVVVTYAYDHRGRMVRKDVSRTDNSPFSILHYTFVWDDWNIIRETLTTNHYSLTTDYVWGLDIDGTLQGAGGVGGLLAVIRSNSNSNSSLYLPTYDANGNISEYVTTNGEIVAHYDYSPFGETLIESGDLASSFTHRFSTKPWCPVMGLYEYQMRKYRPEIGRWLSRDRLGERGSVNLWQYVYNNTLTWFDYLGRAPQYVYPGVIIIHNPDSGRNHIIPSPDWDWGDYDPEFGGKKRSPVGPRIPFPSVTWGPSITILMVTHEFLFSDGCSFYCISWAPVDLAGIGIETSLSKQVSPVTVTYGAHKYWSVGTSATTVDVNVGWGISLPSPIHPSVRLFCLALTEKAKNGCPCKDLKPTSVGGYLE